jgi:hypothetical protein
MLSLEELQEANSSPQEIVEPATSTPTTAPWMADFAPDDALRSAIRNFPLVEQLDDLTMGRFYALSKRDADKAAQFMADYVEWLNSPSYGVTRVRDICAETEGVGEQIRTGKLCILNKESKCVTLL